MPKIDENKKITFSKEDINKNFKLTAIFEDKEASVILHVKNPNLISADGKFFYTSDEKWLNTKED